MTKQTIKTIQTLRNKIEDNKTRFPSISSIHMMLVDLKIDHKFNNETVNIVEFRGQGNVYVNDRHDGKIGKSLEVNVPDRDDPTQTTILQMDSSSSYHSWNTLGYAYDLIRLIDTLNLK